MIDELSDRVHPSNLNRVIQSLGRRNRTTVIRRLRWIEDRLWWHGALRRADLVARFGISPQQASQDIAAYQQARPGFAELKATSKSYVRAPGATPMFPKDPFRWILEETEAEDGNPSVLPLERLATPRRRADPAIVATLLAAYEKRSAVAIEYQSLSRGESATRVICPHHIVNTGYRYHVRAWDGLRGQFADFVIGRIVSADVAPDYPWVDAVADRLWEEEVEIVVAPAEKLSPAQRKAVERDYDMRGGRTAVSVRKALVVYMAEALGLLDEIQGVAAEGVRELRCLNPEVIAPFVPPPQS